MISDRIGIASLPTNTIPNESVVSTLGWYSFIGYIFFFFWISLN